MTGKILKIIANRNDDDESPLLNLLLRKHVKLAPAFNCGDASVVVVTVSLVLSDHNATLNARQNFLTLRKK